MTPAGGQGPAGIKSLIFPGQYHPGVLQALAGDRQE